MFWGKWESSGLNYMEKQVPLTVQKLYEHYFWQKLSKFYDKIDLLKRIRIIYNKRQHEICLKLGKQILNFSSKVSAQRESLYLLSIKENLL